MLKRVMRVFAAALLSIGIVSAPAFADATPSLGKTTVTVSGINSGDTISAYAIATVHIDASNQLQVTMHAGLPEAYDTIDEIAAKLTATDSEKQRMFDTLANAIKATETPAASSTAGTLQLDPGYYLLRTTCTSGNTVVYQYNVVSVWPQIINGAYVSASDFSENIKQIAAPSVTKLIGNPLAATTDAYANGTAVPMQISTTIPSYPVDATHASYVLVGTPTNMGNMTDLDVSAGETVLTKDTHYTLTNNADGTISIAFDDDYVLAHPGQNITVSFKMVLDVDALTGQASNSVVAEFNPSPYNAATASTSPSVVTAQTYGFFFKKLGANAAETPLAGTVFQVMQGNTVVATLTANTQGFVQLNGLANGIYTLHEVSVGVAGFGTVTDFDIMLNATNCTADNEATTTITETNYLAVAAGKDASGADAAAGEVFDPVAEVPELPTTGGVGTIVFSVLGVAIMAVAIVLFIRRKQQK